ncbi:MAG: indolepyruvate ferredoxin oxidoreductase subunit alpha [Oscillospiraceae bacterium]|jgi:indolepyruvate ferredoxin oxidoreductase alpha subunit|nr:indolepyruvate ferredoxin oxidoreductase subunit alpha [Oscillospiraceae bacterium]
MKELLLGNHAITRALYEAGVELVSSYPGTPSSEITMNCAAYKGTGMYAEWSPNEKVGAEVAIGASIAGARAFSGMKHVGLNVAADPLYTASYAGVNGGLVFAVADDPGMHSSQNEQDSRTHAIGAKVAMLEPTDTKDCFEFTKLAFDISEEFDTPVLIRLSTRVCHSQGIIEKGERKERVKEPYKKDLHKYVMMPLFARAKHVLVEERINKLREYAETSPLNKVEINEKAEIGIISSGVAYQYAKEALGDSASYLKLGIVNPLPVNLIKDFASKVKKLYVVEELDPVIETHCRVIGLEPIGKLPGGKTAPIFSNIGEYSQNIIKEAITGKQSEYKEFPEAVPVRPPVLCAGCSHRGVFYVLNKLGIVVSGDIGCYTLAATPPLSAMDMQICMGAGISMAHGFVKVRPDYADKTVGLMGDSTFIHNGITSLIDIAYNRSNTLTLLLDNRTTGMTGGQNHPGNGLDIYDDPAPEVDFEALCKAIGISKVMTVIPENLVEIEKVIKEYLALEEPAVIIFRKPCALIKGVKHKPAIKCDAEKCTGCRICMKIGCPALTMKNKKAVINRTLCVGCGICAQLCKFDAFS